MPPVVFVLFGIAEMPYSLAFWFAPFFRVVTVASTGSPSKIDYTLTCERRLTIVTFVARFGFGVSIHNTKNIRVRDGGSATQYTSKFVRNVNNYCSTVRSPKHRKTYFRRGILEINVVSDLGFLRRLF